MDQGREDVFMEVTSRKIYRSKSSSLFVPRASVIRHTKDFKLQNNNVLLFDSSHCNVVRTFSQADQNKDILIKEEKDSGIDESFDDEEEKNSDVSAASGYYDSDQSLNMEVSSSEEKVDVFPTSISAPPPPPPLKFVPTPNIKSAEELFPHFANHRLPEELLGRDFESSVRHLLKEPELAYLLQLDQYADQGLLKNTLLKLIRSSYIAGNAKKKAKLLLKEYNEENKRNLNNSVIDFSINLLNDKKNYSENKYNSASEQARTNNPLYVMCREFEFGFDNASASSIQKNASVDINNTYISNTASHLFNHSIGNSQVTAYENNLQCEYCHKKFNNKEAAKRHLLTHKGKRTHKCTHCSRSFYEQSSYLRHLKSHSGEKAHKCDQCSMAFSKRSALEVHIRTHTGERPFVCKYCGKGFSISGNLHRHVLIHTGHRPYKCGKCPRAFNNPSHLARHISSFHA